MATYVKGDAVANATSYELLEKSGDAYASLAEASEINFDVSVLNLAAGSHVLVVKAKADGYVDSEYSNEVTYVVEETLYIFTISTTPTDAEVLLTATGYEQSGNSISVPSGTEVVWSVSADGYTTQTDAYTVTGDYTMSVELVSTGEEDGGEEDDNEILNVWNSGVEPTLTKCTYEKDSEKITLTTDDTVTKWYQAMAKYSISGLVSGETYILQATISDDIMTAYKNGEIGLCSYALSTAATTNIIGTTKLAGSTGLDPQEFVADAETATLVVYPLISSSETLTGVSAVFQNFVITKKTA